MAWVVTDEGRYGRQALVIHFTVGLMFSSLFSREDNEGFLMPDYETNRVKVPVTDLKFGVALNCLLMSA